MPDIDKIKEYVFAAVVSEIATHQGNMNQSFLDPEESLGQLRNLIKHNVPEEVWEYIFGKLKAVDGFQTIKDEVVGDYHKIMIGPIVGIVSQENKDVSSLIYKYRAVGPEFLSKALSNLGADEDNFASRPPLSDVVVPASDRVVTLGHNEISEIEERTSEIIDGAEKLNHIDEISGFREVIIGQLKAGREIVRAGSFKLYVLQVTLIDALMFLAKRYERETIGALAGALLAALLKQFELSA